MNLPIIPTIKSVTDLRYQTADIIKILGQNKPVLVTKDNDTVAVMLSPVHYLQIVAFIEELEDKKDSVLLEKAIENKAEFTDFESFDKKQRRKLKIA